jgi:outer membrane immunogenic protein
MRNTFVAVSLLAMSAVSAEAADLAAPPYSKAPVMAPAINWSGFYE